jgi:hypothetical protein
MDSPATNPIQRAAQTNAAAAKGEHERNALYVDIARHTHQGLRAARND